MKIKGNLTGQILLAMVLAVPLGIIINQFLIEYTWVTSYLLPAFHVIGKIFINALKMLVIPLVICSLVSGMMEVGDIRTLGRMGGKAFGLYLFTTAIAVTLALSVANIINPGVGSDIQVPEQTTSIKEPPGLDQVLINLVPSNIFSSATHGEMLPIIFFTLLMGVAMILAGKPGRDFGQFFVNGNEVMMKMVTLVMNIAPIGIFALITKVFSELGSELLLSMLGYFMTVVITLLLHVTLTYPLLLKTFSGLNPLVFIKKMRAPLVFAFSTASSSATIPITLRTVEKRLGVENSIASFTVPFGATINMDGTAIMQGVATVFIANVYGIDLSIGDFAAVVLTAVLASIGTAGVPGVGLIMLAMVLGQVGLPLEGIALIIGVDRLLDMMRTAVNVSGDATVTCIVAKGEKALHKDIFTDPHAGAVEEVHIDDLTKKNT